MDLRYTITSEEMADFEELKRERQERFVNPIVVGEPNRRQPPSAYAWRFRTDPPGKWREVTLQLPTKHEVFYKALYEQPEPLPYNEIMRIAMRYLEMGTERFNNRDFDAFLRKIVFGIDIATGPIPADPHKEWYDDAQVAANEHGYGPGTAADAIHYFAGEAEAYANRTRDLVQAISTAYHTEDATAMRQILYTAIEDEVKAEIGHDIATVVSIEGDTA